jgi:hypothetical protein
MTTTLETTNPGEGSVEPVDDAWIVYRLQIGELFPILVGRPLMEDLCWNANVT